MRVGLNDKWDNQKLENKWVISSYEIYNSESEPPSLLMVQLQGVGLGTPKLTEPNPTTNALKSKSLIQWFLSHLCEKLCPLGRKRCKRIAVKLYSS
ncbi:hypothetical protein HpHUE59_01300 [Helicobacter pylori]